MHCTALHSVAPIVCCVCMVCLTLAVPLLLRKGKHRHALHCTALGGAVCIVYLAARLAGRPAHCRPTDVTVYMSAVDANGTSAAKPQITVITAERSLAMCANEC
jgi:hypothetical protein